MGQAAANGSGFGRRGRPVRGDGAIDTHIGTFAVLPVQINQLAFQFGLFFLHFLDDDLAKHFVQLPQIVCRHRPKHGAIYRITPIDIHPVSPHV